MSCANKMLKILITGALVASIIFALSSENVTSVFRNTYSSLPVEKFYRKLVPQKETLRE